MLYSLVLPFLATGDGSDSKGMMSFSKEDEMGRACSTNGGEEECI
jgi:hypothetical protein